MDDPATIAQLTARIDALLIRQRLLEAVEQAAREQNDRMLYWALAALDKHDRTASADPQAQHERRFGERRQARQAGS